MIGTVAAVAILVPTHAGSGRAVIPRAPAYGDNPSGSGRQTFTSSAAEERAAQRSEAAVQPLARAFVNDLSTGRKLAQAYALLAPSLRRRYALGDWQQGRDLPLARTGSEAGVSIAFSGAATVGVVADLDGSRLFAVRFEKTGGRWLVDYMHLGHGSQYVSASNFAPAGFVPGSRHETVWTWFALVGGLVGLIAIGVVVERRLSPST